MMHRSGATGLLSCLLLVTTLWEQEPKWEENDSSSFISLSRAQFENFLYNHNLSRFHLTCETITACGAANTNSR